MFELGVLVESRWVKCRYISTVMCWGYVETAEHRALQGEDGSMLCKGVASVSYFWLHGVTQWINDMLNLCPLESFFLEETAVSSEQRPFYCRFVKSIELCSFRVLRWTVILRLVIAPCKAYLLHSERLWWMTIEVCVCALKNRIALSAAASTEIDLCNVNESRMLMRGLFAQC